jgi:hypothetical protein
VAKFKDIVAGYGCMLKLKARKGMEARSVQEDVPLHDENISGQTAAKNRSG